MNNITIYQIQFALFKKLDIDDISYKDAKIKINHISKVIINNNYLYSSKEQEYIFNRYKLLIKIYELYHFINLDWVVNDSDLYKYFNYNKV